MCFYLACEQVFLIYLLQYYYLISVPVGCESQTSSEAFSERLGFFIAVIDLVNWLCANYAACQIKCDMGCAKVSSLPETLIPDCHRKIDSLLAWVDLARAYMGASHMQHTMWIPR